MTAYKPEERGGRCGEGCSSSSSILFPTRYFLATLGAVGLLCSVGIRKTFAIVLTHVTAQQSSLEPSEELFFPNCTVYNTSRDLHVPMGEDTMFFLHATYFAGFPFFSTASAVLATRVSAVYVIGVAVALTSVVTLALPYVIKVSVPFLFVLRLLQGAIDGIQQPCTVGVLSAWSTGSDNARLFSIYFTGAYLAPALAALLSGITICYVSWNSILFVYGGCGVVWSVVWVLTAYDTPALHPSLSDAEAKLHARDGPVLYHKLSDENKERQQIPWRGILTSPAVWSVFLGFFCHTHVYSMLVVEQAQYFSDAFNIHIADIGLLTTMPHLGLSVTCLLAGFLSDKLLHWGLSTTFTRKLLFSIGKLTEGGCLLGLYVTGDWQTAITLLTSGVTVGGLAEAGYHPIPADLSPQWAGVIYALTGIGAIGAFVNTFVASFILGQGKTLTCVQSLSCRLSKNWQTLFLISGVLEILTVIAFNFMATAEPQPWGSAGEPPTTPVLTVSTVTKPPRSLWETICDVLQSLLCHINHPCCKKKELFRPTLPHNYQPLEDRDSYEED